MRIAEETRGRRRMWGRLGGSSAERASARLLADQLRPWSHEVRLESFDLQAHRPRRWEVRLRGGRTLSSAFPAPFDARFPSRVVRAPVELVTEDSDWSAARGKWAFLEATMNLSPGRNSVREGLLYERAREAQVAGFIFSLPTPAGRWTMVPAVDKPFALEDEVYPDRRRPFPCYCVDSVDGRRLWQAAERGDTLEASIRYEPTDTWEALNTVAYLRGSTPMQIGIFNHLDCFFSGACDNASGIATTVGLAARLARLDPAERLAHFYFVGLSSHHDRGGGMRNFKTRDLHRFGHLNQLILIEHTDALPGRQGRRAGWPEPLGDLRSAFVGPGGWPEVSDALPELIAESGLMTVAPRTVEACIGDLHAVCRDAPSFCLIQAPPFYHTNYDTMDKISRGGMEAAVDFHMRLLEVTGALAPGVARG